MYPLPEHIEAEIKLEHSHILKRIDGIVEIRCTDDFIYDVQQVKENHHYLKEFAVTEKVLVLSFTEAFTSITNEARAYIAKGYHRDYVAAEAFLIHSLAQRLLANFFVTIGNPIVPVSFFNYKDKDVSEKWLLEHRKPF